MLLAELKSQIEQELIADNILVFDCKGSTDFIALQYAERIAEIKGLEIRQVMDILEEFQNSSEEALFDDVDVQYLKLYITDKLVITSPEINQLKNFIIIAKDGVSDSAKQCFTRNIIDIPNLESWQVKDYLYSMLPYVPHENLDWLQGLCKDDMFRLREEVERLRIFGEEQANKIRQFYADGIYSDLTNYTMLNLVTAIQKRDLISIRKVYNNLKDLDESDMLFCSLLCTTFRNMIQVQLGYNVTSASTLGVLSDKQIYAISKLPKVYNSVQIMQIYEILTDIPRKIRTGEMPTGEFLIDYLLVKILSL